MKSVRSETGRPKIGPSADGCSHNNYSLDKGVVAACPIRIDYARLPQSYCG